MPEERLLKVLKIITKKLKGKNINWLVVGSASLTLQGVKIKAKDIDILTTKIDAYRINSILKEFEVRPIRFSKSKIFSSHLGKFKINNARVDVMGNLKANVNGRWVSLCERLKHPKYIEIQNIKIPVSHLKDQLKVYELVKRRKNFERVRKIKEFLKIA